MTSFSHISMINFHLCLIPVKINSPSVCHVDYLCFEDEVFHLILFLKLNKKSGSVNITVKMLRATAVSITPAIMKLFDISIVMAQFLFPIEGSFCCTYAKSK